MSNLLVLPEVTTLSEDLDRLGATALRSVRPWTEWYSFAKLESPLRNTVPDTQTQGERDARLAGRKED